MRLLYLFLSGQFIVRRILSIWFYSKIARLKFIVYGCHCEGKIKVDGPIIVRVSRKDAIHLGKGIRINSKIMSNLVGVTNPTIFNCIGEGKIEIGERSGLSSVVISSRALVKIGKNVKIGGNARIFDHDFHSLNHSHRRDNILDQKHCQSSPVKIGDDVFIGTNSIILKGVTIGNRTIIGAGSVVTLKNIPPDSIVAGNPARILSIKNG